MRVHLCQFDLAWQDRAANHARVRDLLQAHPPAAGDLVVLPEMFPVGYSMDVAAIADRDGDTERFIGELAQTHRVTIVAGNVTQPDDLGRNQAFVADPEGRIVTRYDKLHPFRYANEQAHFAAGTGIAMFDWQGMRAAPFICYDLRFPEVFRLAAKAGAELLIVIANWPTVRVAHWVALLTARAIENQAYVIGVNRTGVDPNAAYPGRSMVIDPRGNTIVDAGDHACVISCEIDLADLRAYRREFPALSDLRFI